MVPVNLNLHLAPLGSESWPYFQETLTLLNYAKHWDWAYY